MVQGIFGGFPGSPRDFFGSCRLAPFDHPRHLKSLVPPLGSLVGFDPCFVSQIGRFEVRQIMRVCRRSVCQFCFPRSVVSSLIVVCKAPAVVGIIRGICSKLGTGHKLEDGRGGGWCIFIF